METEQKKPVKLITIGVLVILMTTVVFIKTLYFDNTTLITVTGDGSVKAAPTQVQLTVSVTNSSITASQALQDNINLTKNLIAISKRLGVADSDVIVSYARVTPVAISSTQIGYQALNALGLTFKNISNFDNNINTLYNQGASSISNIVFTTENSQFLEKQAITKAIDDANKRADEIANSLHKRVVRAMSISTSEVGGAGATSGESGAQFSAAVKSSPSQIEINRQASIVFELR